MLCTLWIAILWIAMVCTLWIHANVIKNDNGCGGERHAPHDDGTPLYGSADRVDKVHNR